MRELLSRGTNGNSAYIRTRRRPQAAVRQATMTRVAASARLRIYVSVLGVAAVGTVVALGIHGSKLEPVWALLCLAAAAALAERERVWLNSDTEASISLIPILFAA